MPTVKNSRIQLIAFAACIACLLGSTHDIVAEQPPNILLETAFALNLVDVKDVKSIGFEEAKSGPFDKLETEIGTWTPEVGRTIVDKKHAKTGKHCLQLTGGKKTSVILQIADDFDTSGVLSFWAERWTVRKPFSFRIDKQTADGWQEIYNGDARVRVGRAFLNHVKIPLGDDGIQKLRFTCTSPPNTGILIDDIRIALAPDGGEVLDRRIIFQQRTIPEGVPLEGHAEDAKLYGYRIPSLLVTKRGSILAFSERRLGLHDHAQNDIVLKRSTDNGKTWSDSTLR